MRTHWKRTLGMIAGLFAVAALALPGAVAFAEPPDTAGPAPTDLSLDLSADGRIILHGAGTLEAAGRGFAKLVGHLTIAGRVHDATIVVIDHAGDAVIRINDRAAVRSDSTTFVIHGLTGGFYVSGSRVELEIRSDRMRFETRGVGSVFLAGLGWVSLNGGPPRPWPNP